MVSLEKSLCGRVLIFLSKYLGMELLGCRVNVSLTFIKLPDTAAKWLCHLILPATVYEHCCCSILLPTCSSFGVTNCFLFLLFVFLKEIVVDSQCCVIFRCTAEVLSCTYTYINSFLDSFPYRPLQNIE